MKLDISDILADVRSSSPLSPSSHDQLALTAHLDHQQLTRLWTLERTCPDVLPSCRACAHRSRASKTSPPASCRPTSPRNQNVNLTLSILETDLSRTQFLVRSLLRQRLAKLTKHAGCYLTQLHADANAGLLSPSEGQGLARVNVDCLKAFLPVSTRLNPLNASIG
jgi:GINS complex subunit 4